MKKYELLTNDTVVVYGKTLYRIRALKDFSNIKVGDLGGYIEKEENLSQFGDARVSGDARVFGDAWVSGNAWVFSDARVSGDARVFGDAWVSGNAWVSGDARVFGNAEVFGNADVSGDAWVSGDARVSGNNDYCTINGFGSQNRTTTFFRLKDKNDIGVKCGCFCGTLEEFREKIKETHKDSYLAEEYLDIANLMEKRFRNRSKL